MNKLLLVPLLAALAAAPAWAETGSRATAELTPAPQSEGLRDLIEVHGERNPAAVIARDALYGGLAGLLIGAGVGLLEGNNLGRDIAIGAGAGLLVGGIFGAVDAVFTASLTELEAAGLRAEAAQSIALGKSLEAAEEELVRAATAGAGILTYGTDPAADVRATTVEEDARRLRVGFAAPSGEGRLELRLAGRFIR